MTLMDRNDLAPTTIETCGKRDRLRLEAAGVTHSASVNSGMLSEDGRHPMQRESNSSADVSDSYARDHHTITRTVIHTRPYGT